MAVLTLIQQHRTIHYQTLFDHPKISINKPRKPIIQILSSSLQRTQKFTKRTALKIASTSVLFFLLSSTSSPVSVVVVGKDQTQTQTASAFEFRITTPEQTLEEAESGIQGHAESLLKVKDLLKEESWKAAQKALRESSAYLKQDIYTIIQSKPGIERPELRKMYSVLFNSVSSLDYAARDKDVPRIWECYDTVVLALQNILQRI